MAVKTISTADFTGGLNLTAVPTQLRPNELAQASNVDIGPNGGVRRRWGFGATGPELPSTPVSLGAFQGANGEDYLLMWDGDKLYKASVSDEEWTEILDPSSSSRMSFLSYNSTMYVMNGVGVARKVGTEVEELDDASAAWNNDLTVPVGGTMPIAKLGTTARDSAFLFVGNTKESNVRYPSRVRWSHQLSETNLYGPEDWRQCDFVDLGFDADGDELVALELIKDHLVGFKQNSMWGVYGTPPNAVVAQLISSNIGAVGPMAVASSDIGIFFFSWPEGVFLYDGQSIRWLFNPLSSLLDKKQINAAKRANISLGYYGRRLYVSVPMGSSTVNNRTYVYDLSVGKGAWTQYDIGWGDTVEVVRDTTENFFLAAPVGTLSEGQKLLHVNARRDQDTFDGEDDHPVTASFTTAWFGANNMTANLRWRRPIYVVDAPEGLVIVNQTQHNYEAAPAREVELTTTTSGSQTIRGDLMGKAHVVATKFIVEDSVERWSVDGITLRGMPGQAVH